MNYQNKRLVGIRHRLQSNDVTAYIAEGHPIYKELAARGTTGTDFYLVTSIRLEEGDLEDWVVLTEKAATGEFCEIHVRKDECDQLCFVVTPLRAAPQIKSKYDD